MIAVTIIGLLASLSIPAMQKARQNSVATALANNFRIYGAAFEIYKTEQGQWPADVNRGIVPPEMTGQLPRFNESTQGNGRWDWDFESTKVRAGISLKGSSLDPAIIRRVDTILDDGNLASGRFINTSSGATYVLEF